MQRFLAGHPALADHRPRTRQSADPIGLQILTREHGHHTRRRQSRLRVDGLDPSVRMRRAQERAHKHVGALDIGDIVAMTRDEAFVLFAKQGDANAGRVAHAHTPFCVCMAAVPAITDATMFW